MRSIFFYIRYILVFFCLSSNAQVIDFIHFNSDNGLPENTGQAIIEDSDGFIWIGTQNGLARYDGYEFLVFKHHPNDSNSLSNNQVESLFEDKNGFIWIGTRNGLNRLSKNSLKFERFYPDKEQNLESNWFTHQMKQDHQGHIWVSNFYGIFEIENWEKRKINFFEYPNTKRAFNSFVIDDEQNLWISKDSSIYLLKNQKIELAYTANQVIYNLFLLNNQILVGCESGLRVLKKGNLIKDSIYDALENLIILNLFKDSKNKLWVITNNGCFVYKNNLLIHHLLNKNENPNSLSHNLCLSILEDSQGLMWIGTGQGVNRFDPQQNQIFNLSKYSNNQFYAEHIEVIHQSDKQTLWLGTANGLHKIKFNEPKPLWTLLNEKKYFKEQKHYSKTSHSSFEHNNIDYLFQYTKNILLIGTSSGNLYALDINKDTIEKIEINNKGKQLRGIHKINNTEVLILAYANKLLIYDFTTRKSLPSNWLPSIYIVQTAWIDNCLWVGNNSSLYQIDFDEKRWTKIISKEGYNKLTNSMLTHALNTKNTVWISTFGGGLFSYNKKNKNFNNYTEIDGLGNNNVWSVYADSSQKLWMSTDNGISIFDIKSQSFTILNTVDGLNFNDFSMTSHAQASDGTLLFGNPKGLTAINPYNFQENQLIPNFYITHFQINYKNQNSRLIQQSENTQHLTLYPDDKILSFKISVLNFRNPKNNSWAWKMPGLQKDWVVKKGFDRQLTFTDLSPGKHIISFKAANNHGHWNPIIKHLIVHVKPPYYKTWWFKSFIFLVIFIVFGLLIFIYNRKKYQKQMNVLLLNKKIQNERERISKDLHDHVGAHLSKIVGDLDILELKMKLKQSDNQINEVEKTRDFTYNTIQLLRDTIWAINKDAYSFKDFGEKISLFLNQFIPNSIKWNIIYELDSQIILGPNEALNLLRIIQESTQNMLKHSKASQYEIKLKTNKNIWAIIITDDGVGFNIDNHDHCGYGLKNMQNRAKEIAAYVSIESNKQSGTKIIVTNNKNI